MAMQAMGAVTTASPPPALRNFRDPVAARALAVPPHSAGPGLLQISSKAVAVRAGSARPRPALVCWRTLAGSGGFLSAAELRSRGGKSPAGQWTRNQRRKKSCAMASMTLISPTSHTTLWAVLMGCAAAGKVLEVHTRWGAQLTAPLLSLFLTMMLSSLRITPASSPAYDGIWQVIMPLAVALSLLETNVQRAFTDAGATLTAFWLGAAGTILGTVIAFAVVGPSLGEEGWKMAACLCASYIGGSINYAATAQALSFGSGAMLAAGIAADNLLMVLYFGIVMWLPDHWQTVHNLSPQLFGAHRAVPPPPGIVMEAAQGASPGSPTEVVVVTATSPVAELPETLVAEAEASPSVESLTVSLATAAAACVLGQVATSGLPSTFAGVELGVTALLASACSAIVALVTSRRADGASTGSARVATFCGAETLGGAFMLLFFSVVGASAGIHEALIAGWRLLSFGLILLGTHLGVILFFGHVCKLPLKAILIASNANVGGPATAAAMASARCWPNMIRPALLTGTLGYTIGTAIGCTVGWQLLLPMVRV